MRKYTSVSELQALFSASTASAAFGTAIETGLLWLLAETPMDGPAVAEALNIPSKRCHYWLQFLSALGILDRDGAGYTTSALTRAAILETHSQESWRHLAVDERERAEGVLNLGLYIREPGSIWAAQGMPYSRDYVEKMRSSYERAREFTRMLYELHQRLASDLAEIIDLFGVRRLLDVGGGSGVVSMALLRKDPSLTATVVDQDNVCIAGREIAEENGLAHRISYQPADLMTDDFPAGFDMVLKCDVGLYSVGLLRRMWASLNPGGVLVVAENLSPEENLAPEARIAWTFIDSLEDPDFTVPTIGQLQEQLTEAGFEPLPGVHTLSTGRVVIQARKGTDLR